MKKNRVKKTVRKTYSQVATDESSCGCSCSCCGGASPDSFAEGIGYSKQEINVVPEANLGLGCGNPTAIGEIKEGDVVLDLGSGSGFDSFLALRKVGPTGYVIGVDMTKEMIKRAKLLAEKYSYDNVEFRYGDIENLPVEDNSVDIVISNCVINLAPDKLKVFQEAYRVLKKGGKMYITDIVLLKELDEEQKNNDDLLSGCVAGALLKDNYLGKIKQAGFEFEIMSEDKEIKEKQYQSALFDTHGIAMESLKLKATKNG